MRESEAVTALINVLGTPGWLESTFDVSPFLTDSRGAHSGKCLGVALPANTSEVAQTLRICNAARIGIVPQGGNTGRCAGATPNASGQQIVLGLKRLNHILDMDPTSNTATVEAGCILAEVRAAAEKVDRLFPLSLGAEGSCQIGGNLATNAGGTNVLRYGNARDLALGLEVVLPDGRVWDGLNSLRKNNTGYDLKDLFIGSEGSLGVITTAVLKLVPRPTAVASAFLAVPDPESSLEVLTRAQVASGNRVETFELLGRTALEFPVRHIHECRDPFEVPHPWYVLLELAAYPSDDDATDLIQAILESAFDEGLVTDAVVAGSLAHAQDFWRLREGVVEAQAMEGASIKHDISLPLSKISVFLEEAASRVQRVAPGCRPCPFGHLGDGNIHYNVSQPEALSNGEFLAKEDLIHRTVHDLVAELGGSFSAEHGIGLIKVDDMSRYKSPVELEIMASIKQTLDPAGIMNPGKVLPPSRETPTGLPTTWPKTL